LLDRKGKACLSRIEGFFCVMEKIHSKALDNTAKVIFVDHMGTCLVDAVHHGNEQEVIQELKKA